MASDDGSRNGRIGWKLRDLVGLSVIAVWAGLHAVSAYRGDWLVPGAVDNAMLVVLGWWPIGAAADVLRSIRRRDKDDPVAADPGVAAKDKQRDGEGATAEAKA